MKGYSRQISISHALELTSHCIALTAFLSVVRNISPFSSSVFIAAYIAASYISSKNIFRISRAVLNIFALLLGAAIASRASLANLGGSIIDMLFLFIIIKALEQKMARDYMQIYALSVLLLASSSLLAIDIIFVFYFVLMLFLVSIAAVLLSYFSQDENMFIEKLTLKKIITRSMIIPAIALPLTAIMFIILPRTALPLWGTVTKQDVSYSGFSDKVDLGSVSSIQESKAVILRVKTERLADQHFYWRGIVLDSFNGRTWSASSAARTPALLKPITEGQRVTQSVFLEPYGNNYLFALDKPTGYSARNTKYLEGNIAMLRDVPRSRIRYDAVSHLSDILPEPMPDKDLYLNLPDKELKNTRQLAKSLTSGLKAEDAALIIISYLNSKDFEYSLSSLPISENPIEDFLFRTKKGNCEYFASTMAVMLRMSGIHTRLVGGYRGGEYNELGGYYFVTQNEAHVWVEAYMYPRGWVRFDPTPSYPAGYRAVDSRGLLQRIKLIADAANYFWNSFVIPYNFEEQFVFLSKIRNGLTRADLLNNLNSPVALTITVLAFVAIVFFWLKRAVLNRKMDPYAGFVSSFDNILTKRGYIRNKGEGLEEFAKRVEESELRASAFKFAAEFHRLYYRDIKADAADKRKLKNLLKAIKNIPKKDEI
ncbi:MAG: DUF3488 domain-containing transglutaminase family protein [Nitrospirae bacterium]|nr:DUF3488 domain-containing transglutaminase family protein [Nitrospirota bacterium]